MGDGGVSIPPWSVTIGPPRSVLGRQREQIVLTFDQERHVPFGACYVMPKRNTPLLGHLGTVLRLDGTYVWTER